MARQNERKMNYIWKRSGGTSCFNELHWHQYQGGSLRRHMRRTRISRKRLYKEKWKFTEKNKGNDQEKNEVKDQRENNAQNTAGNAEESQETIADGQYPIMGNSRVTVDEMVDYFQTAGKPYPKEALSKGGAESIEVFCRMYYDEAVAEGVRPEVAFVQTMKETGFLQYGGDASVEQFNFAGLGTTGGGVPGNSYPDVRTGIRAQIQHLKAYATADPLNGKCVDDRYEYVKKGAAPYVEWLGQQENPEGLGWATGDNYGYDIVKMIQDMKK